MGDIVSKETRSRMMSNIRSISKLEDRVCSELWRRGFRFRRNTKKLPGKPDISISKYKIVIFIDSCFWHNCPEHGNMPKTNSGFWKKKLNDNKLRDIKINEYYVKKRWHILRVWEHDIKYSLLTAVDYIDEFIRDIKNKSTRSII